VVAPLYLNEISPVNLRGAMGTLNQLGVTVGILLSQVLGLTQTLGTRELYQWLFGEHTIYYVLFSYLINHVVKGLGWD